jgi:hypothetical protein
MKRQISIPKIWMSVGSSGCSVVWSKIVKIDANDLDDGPVLGARTPVPNGSTPDFGGQANNVRSEVWDTSGELLATLKKKMSRSQAVRRTPHQGLRHRATTQSPRKQEAIGVHPALSVHQDADLRVIFPQHFNKSTRGTSK